MIQMIVLGREWCGGSGEGASLFVASWERGGTKEKKRSITKCARIVFTINTPCARCVIVGVERGERKRRKKRNTAIE